jgi:hypothetical protein
VTCVVAERIYISQPFLLKIRIILDIIRHVLTKIPNFHQCVVHGSPTHSLSVCINAAWERICELCIYCEHYSIISVVRYTIYGYFYTCSLLTSPQFSVWPFAMRKFETHGLLFHWDLYCWLLTDNLVYQMMVKLKISVLSVIILWSQPFRCCVLPCWWDTTTEPSLGQNETIPSPHALFF